MRQGSFQQPSYNQGPPIYNQGLAGGFNGGPMRPAPMNYVQGRGPMNQQRQGLGYQQQRRGTMGMQRRGNMGRPLGGQPNGRYTGVVVVLGRAPCDHPLAQEQARV